MTSPSSPSKLVGRSGALRQLQDRLTQARAGSGQVILISGEAGIGKSRLLNEARTIAAGLGFDIVSGRCFEQERGLPCAPFIDILRAISEHTLKPSESSTPLARLLPELGDVPVIGDAEQDKRRLFDALADVLAAEPLTRPSSVAPAIGAKVILIDDLHWADDVTLEFLLFLARRTRYQTTVSVLSYRKEEITPVFGRFITAIEREALGNEIPLGRLALEQTREMICSIFNQTRVRDEFVDAVQLRTDGNPLFIEETLKSLVSDGDIFTERGEWTRKPLSELRIPLSVQDAVQRQAALLSEDARQVVETAAAIGQRFQFNTLSAVTGRGNEDLLLLVRELLRVQLIVEHSAHEFEFRHALTREAVYANLLKRERLALHAAIGSILRANAAAPSALAHHFYEAESWAEALQFARVAAEQAQSLYAHREAIDHLSRAIHAAGLVSHIAEIGLLRRSRAKAHEALGHFDEARADYEEALTLARANCDATAEWENLLSLGFLWTGRDMGRAGTLLDQALICARTIGEASALSISLNRIGNWRINMERSNEALRCHEEALQIVASHNDQSGLALTHDLLGITHLVRGDYLAASEHHDQAIRLFRASNSHMSLASTLATACMRGGCYQGDVSVFAPVSIEECWELGAEAIQIARQIGWRAGEANANAFLALAMGARGAYERALRCARDSLDIALDIDAIWEGVAHIAFGKTHLDCLALESARMHFDQAVAYARRVGAAEFLSTALSFLASAMTAQGELGLAHELLTELPHIAPAETQTTSQRLVSAARAELLLAGGRPADALRLVDDLIAIAPNVSECMVVPRLWRMRAAALAKLHRTLEAQSMLHDAARTAESQALMPQVWRIQLELGVLLRTQRRRTEAEAHFQRAREVVDALAGELPDAVLRLALQGGFDAMCSEVPTPLQSAKRAFDGLTAREREVAALVAQGKSNRAIAERLVIGERTVEKHVENAMGKLGFSARTQLAVWAHDRRLI